MSEHKINLAALAASKAAAAHSIFSPSASHMWLACSGSLVPNVLGSNDAGVDAAYGTVAHSVTEEWLSAGRRPDHLLGTNVFIDSGDWGFLIDIDEEMFHFVEQAVDRSEWVPGDQLVEYRVDFSHLTPIPNQRGTLDFAAMRPGSCTLDDHKFGSSPENIVYAEENPQLMLYAIGLDAEFGPKYNFKEFTLRINQPILRHFDEWTVSRGRLMDFADYVRQRAAAAWQIDAPRTAGAKQCRFCRVRASCAANAKMQEELVSAVFRDETVQTVEQMQEFVNRIDDDLDPFKLHFAQVGQLTTAQMARLLPFRHMADSWWKALAAELDKRAAAGEKIPGMKIVEGRTHRQFKDEAKAREYLLQLGLARDAIIKESLVSPNQAETLLRRAGRKTKELPELFNGWVYKPPGKATIVPLSDRRDELVDVAGLVFGDEAAENL